MGIKRKIILIEIIIIVMLFYVAMPKVEAEKADYIYMTCTAYSNHPKCINDRYRDGLTATMTPIREGVCAINCDYIDGKWIVKSPLKLGDRIYIEGLGEFIAEDTGSFSETDFHFDFWNVDIFIEDYNEAVKFGRQLRHVYILEG